jgi:L-malate glycosyltransferase
MKILLLSDSNSIHTIKWVKALSEAGISIGLFSFYPFSSPIYNEYKNILLSNINLDPELRMTESSRFSKLVYLKAIKQIKKLIKEFKPDILHAHYASSYGLIGALTSFHPFVTSVWGEDVYDFPNKSILHKSILKYNLKKADAILSTSFVMKNETKKYTNKEITVTPFGIDIDIFKPMNEPGLFDSNTIVIGTIKALEKKYGIEYLIKAFHTVKKRNTDKQLKLLIVGKGSQEHFLKQLVKNLDIENDVTFTGFIDHRDVPKYHNMLDIFVSVSIDDSESFGVAILEAGACGKPVIVSDVGGLPEVVVNGETGFVVESKNSDAIASSICKLIDDPELRVSMGNNGRKRVQELYNWNDSVKIMISVYDSLISK